MSVQASREQHLTHDQRGLVSLMVTMILMIVISLIVIGFAQVSRRNQRQATDRQLSTQAFYAAETGVNDAGNLITQAANAGLPIAAKTSCADTGGGFYSSLNGTVDAATNVRYTCLIVNPAPSALEYSTVDNHSLIVLLNSATGANINQVNLVWLSKADGATPLSGCPANANTLPSTTAWACGYGLLRFDLVPVAGNQNINGLSSNVMTVFAVPTSGGTNSIAFGAGGPHAKTAVRCNNTNCTLAITGLNSPNYYLRVSSVYKDASLRITATGGGAPLNLSGAQALVDATGKAQDILRRIQVRLPLAGTTHNQLPDYVMQTNDSICKRFSIMQGYFQSDVSGVTSTNPLCNP